MRELAAAAELLGMDVNAPPLPETGTAEAAKAARAFNVMAERIRRFVRDRTFMLTAIGHDLRTPITRLKLRAEWMEDEEQQRKMLADLDELEAMVAATLAFGRDDANTEGLAPLDLAELLRTILDEAADARPDAAEQPAYAGPDHQVVRARPLALKRALSNLVQNALNYGGAARVSLAPPRPAPSPCWWRMTGPACPPRSWSACSNRSIAWRPAATAKPAAPGWGCRSPATSCARMAATSCCRTAPGAV